MDIVETKPATIDRSTRLSVERTRLSYERTLMSWLRTSVSLISFGFTIYKFFQFELNDGLVPYRLIGPREFALALITMGLLSLLLATIQHSQSMRALRARFGEVPRSTAIVVTGLFSIVGVVTLIAVLLRL